MSCQLYKPDVAISLLTTSFLESNPFNQSAIAKNDHSYRSRWKLPLWTGYDSSDTTATAELDLKPLPYTRTEADTILEFLQGQSSLGIFDFEANLNRFKRPDLSNYQIIHFATHGILNPDYPELSGLVVSLVDPQGNPQNGFLRLNDIFNLNLPAELVVLSACQTGSGKNVKGEGIVGLTRGFMYADAPRTIASLWNVNDASTAELMSQFYQKYLQENLPPAEALRQAQLAMWQSENIDWRNPYF
ncbi:CHAT domain-containing protein [Coleofasciculus sp.]|uniref:CHAT domain-containing protein n=1 Tax=Coleofasciculus sp. TaxID=3100458 RepID=UPI003A3C5A07